MRSWLAFLFVLAFSTSSIAQVGRIRVSSDVAASHFKSGSAPEYPAFAQTGRIQGNVILHILIDEDGNVSPWRVVRGHPMLVPAANSAVRNWKYEPFTANGHLVPAITVAVVRFGNPSNHDAEDRAEVAFQDAFWTALERAQATLGTDDFAVAEKNLSEIQASLLSGGSPTAHLAERWQWAMSMGDLQRRGGKFVAAEQRYTEALNLQRDNKNGPEAAGALLALGVLYFESSMSEQANEKLVKAKSLIEKNFKTATMNSSAQEIYGRAIVHASWMLSKIALNNHNQEEALRQCRNVLDHRNSLPSGDLNVQDCEKLLTTLKPTIH